MILNLAEVAHLPGAIGYLLMEVSSGSAAAECIEHRERPLTDNGGPIIKPTGGARRRGSLIGFDQSIRPW